MNKTLKMMVATVASVVGLSTAAAMEMKVIDKNGPAAKIGRHSSQNFALNPYHPTLEYSVHAVKMFADALCTPAQRRQRNPQFITEAFMRINNMNVRNMQIPCADPEYTINFHVPVEGVRSIEIHTTNSAIQIHSMQVTAELESSWDPPPVPPAPVPRSGEYVNCRNMDLYELASGVDTQVDILVGEYTSVDGLSKVQDIFLPIRTSVKQAKATALGSQNLDELTVAFTDLYLSIHAAKSYYDRTYGGTVRGEAAAALNTYFMCLRQRVPMEVVQGAENDSSLPTQTPKIPHTLRDQ